MGRGTQISESTFAETMNSCATKALNRANEVLEVKPKSTSHSGHTIINYSAPTVAIGNTTHYHGGSNSKNGAAVAAVIVGVVGLIGGVFTLAEDFADHKKANDLLKKVVEEESDFINDNEQLKQVVVEGRDFIKENNGKTVQLKKIFNIQKSLFGNQKQDLLTSILAKVVFCAGAIFLIIGAVTSSAPVVAFGAVCMLGSFLAILFKKAFEAKDKSIEKTAKELKVSANEFLRTGDQASGASDRNEGKRSNHQSGYSMSSSSSSSSSISSSHPTPPPSYNPNAYPLLG